MKVICYRLIPFLAAGFLLFALSQAASAGPSLKPGNPGVPGLLAEISQLNAYIAELEAIIQAYEQFSPVPKTGQTQSFFDGDDGDLQIGVPWPDPRFIDRGNGTVEDTLTSLIWTKNANLFGATNWNQALTSCDSCNEGEYTDWRLPNVRELQSLINYGGEQYSMLPVNHPFIGLPASPTWFYWSSSTHGAGDSAWVLSFENGHMFTTGGVSSFGVWCVRGSN